MKTVAIFITIASLIINVSNFAIAQNDKSIASIKAFQLQQNKDFANPTTSPLTDEDIMVFTKLEFFPIDLSYLVKARFTRTPDEMTFAMPTTGSRAPMYVKYGELDFEILSKRMKLNVYQLVGTAKKTGSDNRLFVPFKDKTSGITSYEGGRYIDIDIPTTDEVVLDFNKAYNPYCAYNSKYSCPIPPAVNSLAIEILAGEKAYKNH